MARHAKKTILPIVLVAQSLGGQVISNYIWDTKEKNGIWEIDNRDYPEFEVKEEKFIKFEFLRYFLTTGCNIPLFVAGFEQIKAITKPNPDFQWFNYYDEDDVLGWPLQGLSDSYREIVEDIAIDSGSELINWNPFSHTGYWADDNFVTDLCQKINSLLD